MKSTSGLFYSKHSYLCNKKDYLPLLRVQIKSFHLMIRCISIIRYNFYFLFSKFDFSARHRPFSNVKCVGCSFTSSMTIMQWRSKWPGFTEGPVTTGKSRMPRKTGNKRKISSCTRPTWRSDFQFYSTFTSLPAIQVWVQEVEK